MQESPPKKEPIKKWKPLERTPFGSGIFFDWLLGYCPVCGLPMKKGRGKHQRTFHHIINRETRKIAKAFRLCGVGFYVCKECHRLIDNHKGKNVPLHCYSDKPNVCGTYEVCDECDFLHRKKVDLMHDGVLNGTCPLFSKVQKSA